ncbi:hypothetical protein [Kineococcus rhizosphaerae]|uniref:Uncharacterized protein n=1 Tax=Kineococcus rhizosphaerae TaxID=559628 RepID=A0A2T0R2V1_9ACTN|nr:hypothetical protein [Kineococcus rhizosphaerae]PRY14105.1 hypothetical protein CLV37_107224 [Kineococcus rhizosphaerae]
MTALADRVEEFQSAPVAAAFFVLAHRNDLTPDDLADPAVACAAASTALRELNPWSGTAAWVRDAAVEAARPLRSLVREVLSDERNTWWRAPVRGGSQLLLTGREDRGPEPADVPVPTGPVDPWETYAQKPLRPVITSTEVSGGPVRSSAHAELACGLSDWDAQYPVRVRRLHVDEGARVAEVGSARDWHDLVVRYGDPATHPGSSTNLASASGLDNGLAPTWSAVAADLDGVHLSFAGLLSALYVPVHSAAVGTTTLWGWDWECTHWIRPVLTVVEELPELDDAPRAAEFWLSFD